MPRYNKRSSPKYAVSPTLSAMIVPIIKSEGYHSELELDRRRLFQALETGMLIVALGKRKPSMQQAAFLGLP